MGAICVFDSSLNWCCVGLVRTLQNGVWVKQGFPGSSAVKSQQQRNLTFDVISNFEKQIAKSQD